jgi:hypothetical protein
VHYTIDSIYFNLPAATEVSLGLSVTSAEPEVLHDFIVPGFSTKKQRMLSVLDHRIFKSPYHLLNRHNLHKYFSVNIQ